MLGIAYYFCLSKAKGRDINMLEKVEEWEKLPNITIPCFCGASSGAEGGVSLWRSVWSGAAWPSSFGPPGQFLCGGVKRSDDDKRGTLRLPVRGQQHLLKASSKLHGPGSYPGNLYPQDDVRPVFAGRAGEGCADSEGPGKIYGHFATFRTPSSGNITCGGSFLEACPHT